MLKIRRAIALPLCTIAVAALSLGGCKKVPNENRAAGELEKGEADGETLEAALAADSGLSNTAELIGAADLKATLAGRAPYTIFAPSDTALAKLPAEVVAALKTPEAKPQLTSLLTGHIVPGTVTAADIAKAIDAGGGSAEIKTMAGDVLTFAKTGNRVTVTARGGGAAAIIGDGHQASNGVIHVIDGVLLRN